MESRIVRSAAVMCLSKAWPPYIIHMLLTGVFAAMLEYLNTTSPMITESSSHSLRSLYEALGSLSIKASEIIASTPELLLQLLTVISLIQNRGASLLTEVDHQETDHLTILILSSLLKHELLKIYRASPELLHFLHEHARYDSSWIKQAFFITLLTELQVNGYDITITPEFIASILCVKNKVVTKVAIRLLVLNPSAFSTALLSLQPVEQESFLQQLVKYGYTEPSEISSKKKTSDTYSPEVTAMLIRQLEISAKMDLVDHPSTGTIMINNSCRYITQVFRVGK